MISIITAVDKNMLIGKDNALPWHYHEDMVYFRKITDGIKVNSKNKPMDSYINK